MAVKTWNSTSANMNSAGSYSPSGIPTGGDRLIFPEGATVAPATNMDALAAVTLAEVTISPNCRIDIGGSGNPLELDATLLNHFGTGTLYLENLNGSDWSFYQNSPNVDAATVIASGAAQYPNVNIARGHFRFGASGAGITRMRVTSTNQPNRDAKVTVTAITDYIAYYLQESGEATISVAVPFGRISGGRYTQVQGSMTDAVITGGYVTMGSGGGIIGTSCELMGGTLDLTTYPMSRTMGKIVRYRNAKYLYPSGLTTHTYVDLPALFGA